MSEPDLKQVADAALGLGAFGELGVFEKDGKLYLPTRIKVRSATGEAATAEEVLLTAATPDQRYTARTQARAWAAKMKLDLDRDVKYVDEMENYWLLAYAIRDRTTRSQLEETAQSLTKRFNDFSLKETWHRYNHWCELIDPRYGELTNEQLWQVIAEIASGGTLLPLVAMPGFEQSTCIVFMARAAVSSASAPSWLSSATRSSSEPSTAIPSGESSTETNPGNDERTPEQLARIALERDVGENFSG
jgi:hypothetical protein